MPMAQDRYDRSTCWPAVQHATTVLRMRPRLSIISIFYEFVFVDMYKIVLNYLGGFMLVYMQNVEIFLKNSLMKKILVYVLLQ